MDKKEQDRATLTAIMDRFNKWRYPRASEIKTRLEKGEKLADHDLEFLGRVFEDANDILPIVERNPEFQQLAGKAIALYGSISTLALENEQLKDLKQP